MTPVLSSHRCETCASYTEVVYVKDGEELHVCPCCQSAAILRVVEA